MLLYNPKSGGGKAERFSLAEEARSRGITPVELTPGADLAQLVRDAVANGADALAMAGGDGSQAVVAAIASELDLPYACIPAGTRNHFALDLGVDRDDVVGALDAFVDGGERRVDLAEVNGRVFVNNVSLGLYAEAVQRPGYREAKLRTLLDTVPDVMGPNSAGLDLAWTGPGGHEHQSGAAVLVSNNRYRLGRAVGSGTRPRIDDGLLGVTVASAPTGRGSQALAQRPWREWSAPEFEVDSGRPVPAGVDGEAMTLAAAAPLQDPARGAHGCGSPAPIRGPRPRLRFRSASGTASAPLLAWQRADRPWPQRARPPYPLELRTDQRTEPKTRRRNDGHPGDRAEGDCVARGGRSPAQGRARAGDRRAGARDRADLVNVAPARSLEEASRVDSAVYAAIAQTPTPELDSALSRLSRAADYSRLSIASAAALALAGGPRGRRAAMSGLAAVALTATIVNALIKPILRRRRPDRAAASVPIGRQVEMPASRSFPSGHSAAAFAFATGTGRELPWTTPPLSALAALVAYSRVHTGVHYPIDVIAGSLCGITLATASNQALDFISIG